MAYVFVDGEILTAAKVNAHLVNPDVAAWQNYTPTWNGVTLGDGATSGQWRQGPGFVEVKAQLTVGASTVFAAGLSVYPSLPVAASAGTLEAIPGYMYNPPGTAFTICVFVPGAYIVAPGTRVTGTTPWTPAAGALIRLSGHYRPAA